MGCCMAVPQDSYAFIQRFGKHEKIARPGCLCIGCPMCCNVAGKLSRRIKQCSVRTDTKTKDSVFLNVECTIQYRPLDTDEQLYNAFYRLAHPESQIGSYVDDAVRSFIPTLELDQLFLAKDQIAHDVQGRIEEDMAAFGWKIRDVMVTDINIDRNLKSNMNQQNANRRLRIAAQEVAESQKYTQIAHAQAESEATYLQGNGISRKRQAIVEGMKTSVHEFSDSMKEMKPEDVLDLILVTQYFDTLKELSRGGSTRIIYTNKRPAQEVSKLLGFSKK
mmetsp:Transcript_9522/g.18530  ORF Transcript_9522/g.18530 Transcript_9522/m.18530 type:complete len:277 (+) Transcript_9522:142-972(+)